MLAGAWLFLAFVPAVRPAFAAPQEKTVPPLDPAHNPAVLRPPPKSTLTEEFIWTAGDAAALDPAVLAQVRGQSDKLEPHYFRRRFSLSSVPAEATLYVAGPRAATVFLNGARILEFRDDEGEGRGFHVKTADVAHALRPGENVLAIEAVRGHNSSHTAAGPVTGQVTYGEVLAVKIIPRGIAEQAPPVVVSDAGWRSTLHPASAWESADFNDSAWVPVQHLGVLGSRDEFLQWNADAGLYAWPGYAGIGPALRIFTVVPASVRSGAASARDDLAAAQPAKGSVTLGAGGNEVLLDFGKEIGGRIHLVSSTGQPVTVNVAYGESEDEALHHPYLGTLPLTVPARGEAYGPKSGFRYAYLVFPSDVSTTWARIDAEGIAYPVEYKGWFLSSDDTLNRIWETGAYTARLNMQEGVWDGIKRDRARWMGDLDVSNRTIQTAFLEKDLVEHTLAALVAETPLTQDVNTIVGYSAFWITGLAELYRHQGDIEFLRAQHAKLAEVVALLQAGLDPDGLFTNSANSPNSARSKVFVDWSPGLSADTPDARAATQMEIALALRQAAWLFTQLGDAGAAARSQATAEKLRQAAQSHLVTGATFGSRWQTNAMAVLADVPTPAQQQAIWSDVLARVAQPQGDQDTITPYYGYYVLEAMARLGHRPEALAWMRTYWGGMLDEGATSFWEAYDPRWPKDDFHAHLQADNKVGTYVSLAHAWSSGPTPWLTEQILGIRSTGPGYSTVDIRPDLAGLDWARGDVPTPRGPIRVVAQPEVIQINLPPHTVATLSLPFAAGAGAILLNGHPVQTTPAEDGRRSQLTVHKVGQYTFNLDRGQR